MEQKLITALPWIWMLIIYQTKDTFQEFETNDIVSELYTDCLATSTQSTPLEIETLSGIMGREAMTDLASSSCVGTLLGDGSKVLHQWGDPVDLDISS